MMLQRLATGATGARYRRRPTRGSEALARACAVYTHNASVYVCVVLLNVRPAYEFRRGFCTLLLFILYSYGGYGATPVSENPPQDLDQVYTCEVSGHQVPVSVEEGKGGEGKRREGKGMEGEG